MSKYSDFEEYILHVSNSIKSNFFQRKIKLISHFDADGIASAAIIVALLRKINSDFEFVSVQQLNEKFLFDLRNESGFNYIFTDVGSGQLSQLVSHFENNPSKVLILDHHKISGKYDLKYLEKNDIYQINCHNFGLDGAVEISGAGTSYLFACSIDIYFKKLAHLGLIGAIGDVQIKKEFLPLNDNILKDAIKQNVVEVKKELNFFGVQTKSIAKLLESGSNIKIPSITGNWVSVNAFLNSLKINPFLKYYALTNEQKNLLANKIIEFRKNYYVNDANDIYSLHYLLVSEKDGIVFRDLREFSTLLNACGRQGEYEVGVGCCLNDIESKKKALEILRNYKYDIISALNWYDENKNKKTYVLNSDNYVIINAQDSISANIVGTLASILSKSKMAGESKYVLTMGRNSDNTTKISLRYSGKNPLINMRDVLSKIIDKLGGESGGHDFAAGAIIDKDKESDFIALFINLLKTVN